MQRLPKYTAGYEPVRETHSVGDRLRGAGYEPVRYAHSVGDRLRGG